jgi:repressor LexA
MFGYKLKELRKREKISQKELATQIGVAQSTVGMWENGKNKPEYDTLLKIAEFFEVSVDYLSGKNGTAAHPQFQESGVKIPVLGEVAAGLPIEAIEDIEDYEEIPVIMAKQGNFFALKIRGDSMEPRIKEGDIVIVRKQSDINNGDVAILLLNESEVTCKKVVKHNNGISLISFNAAYVPRFFTYNEVDSLPVQILGKVVELRGKF